MATHFLPVTRLVTKDWNSNMHWQDPAPYFFYPYMLVSPFVTGMNKTREDFGESYKKLKIYADSGGYQIATQGKAVSVLDVLKWQQNIANVAYTVDIPLYSYESDEIGYKIYTEDYFDRAMGQSVKNANLMYESQTNEKMELWAVIQGKNSKELRKWYKYQTREHEFNGYSVAITGSVKVIKEAMSWLDQLYMCYEIDKPIHFLGRCEPLLVLILSKLSCVTGQTYTYDTSSTIVGPRFGKYYDPYFHNLIWLSNDKTKRPNMTKLPCDCPVCSKHDLNTVAGTDYLITLHNLYCRIRFNEYANAIATDEELLDYAINKFLSATRLYSKRQEDMKKKIDNLIYNTNKSVDSLENFY